MPPLDPTTNPQNSGTQGGVVPPVQSTPSEFSSMGSVVGKPPATPFAPAKIAPTGPVAGPSAQSVMNMVLPDALKNIPQGSPESANRAYPPPVTGPTTVGNVSVSGNSPLQQAVSGELQQVTGEQKARTIDLVKAEADKRPEITPLRTYQSDVEMYLKSQNGSLTKIAVAEQNKRAGVSDTRLQKPIVPAKPNADFTPAPNVPRTKVPIPPQGSAPTVVETPSAAPTSLPPQPKPPRPISVVEIGMPPQKPQHTRLIVVLSLALLFLSGGVFASFLFTRESVTPETPKFFFTPTITTDLQKEFNITKIDASGIVSALLNEREKTEIALGSVLSIYFTEGAGDTKTLVSPGRFLQAIGASAPPELTRALSGNLTFGLHSSNGNQPFMILKVTDYQNGFAGMLLWEKTLEKDLGRFFIKKIVVLDTKATTTIATIGENTFGDIVIKNRDVRVLAHPTGTPLLLYAFPDPNTIIITTSERTLEEITKRLLQSRIVR